MIEKNYNTEHLNKKIDMEDFSIFEYVEGNKSLNIYDGRNPSINSYRINYLKIKQYKGQKIYKKYELNDNNSILLYRNEDNAPIYLHIYRKKGFKNDEDLKFFISKIHKINKKYCH